MHCTYRFRILVVGTICLAGMALSARLTTAQGLPAPKGKLADKCQKAIKKSGGAFVGQALTGYSKCSTDILKCFETSGNDLKRFTCGGKVAGKCTTAIDKVAKARVLNHRKAIVKACDVAGLTIDDIKGADGLGFQAQATACNDAGFPLNDVGGLASCVAAQHECLAERMVLVEQPRAKELMRVTHISQPRLDSLSCLTDLVGGGFHVADPKPDGAFIVGCESAISKTAAKFAGAKLKGVQKCVDGAFTCLQTKVPADQTDCLAKAGATCAKEFAKIDTALGKVDGAVDKKCDDPANPGSKYASLLVSADAADLDSPTVECGTALGTYDQYKTCLRNEHEDRVDDLLRAEAPRADELLSRIGCELDTLSCGHPTPSPTATPIATPTPP